MHMQDNEKKVRAYLRSSLKVEGLGEHALNMLINDFINECSGHQGWSVYLEDWSKLEVEARWQIVYQFESWIDTMKRTYRTYELEHCIAEVGARRFLIGRLASAGASTSAIDDFLRGKRTDWMWLRVLSNWYSLPSVDRHIALQMWCDHRNAILAESMTTPPDN